MSILDEFPRSTAQVETIDGAAGSGDLFNAPIARRVFVEDKRRQVRSGTGELTLSETTVYDDDLTKAALYAAGSRVTIGGHTGTVIRCVINRIGDPDVDHLAVQLDHLGALT